MTRDKEIHEALESAKVCLRPSHYDAILAALAAREDAVRQLTEAVGCVLTWAHKVEGVVVIRRDHFDGLSPANAAVRALATRPTPADKEK